MNLLCACPLRRMRVGRHIHKNVKYSNFGVYSGCYPVSETSFRMSSYVCFILLGVFLCTPFVEQARAQNVHEAQLRREAFILNREKEMRRQLKIKEDDLAKSLMTLAEQRKSVNKTLTFSTNPDDVEALKALYRSTNGSKWNNNTGWLKGDPCGSPFWYGVYCRDGRVLQINLVYNGLSGAIPAELAKASALQVFRGYSNLLQGKIPPEIFDMQSLQIFDVNTNILSGNLPSKISMANLTYLSLYGNNFNGEIPSEWDAPNLQSLELSSNQFTGQLSNSLGQSTSLLEIVVSRNKLTGTLPASYGNMKSLQRLWLFYNYFTNPSIPSSWQGMKSMQDIQADGLYGEFPSWIGQSWPDLRYLVIVQGQLTGEFPESLCDCRELEMLRIFNNSMTGSLPTCLCQLRKLKDIELSDNAFTGPIPYCIGDIPGIESLVISRTNVDGKFPDTIGNLRNLSLVDISSNKMTGSIPNTINNLQEIAGFFICYNKFSRVESGLENFFNRIKDYSCAFYSNPWSCPVSSEVPKECQAECSQCNSGNKHDSCSSCIQDTDCGWCNEGPNCLEGSQSGPESIYKCLTSDWSYGGGSDSSCP